MKKKKQKKSIKKGEKPIDENKNENYRLSAIEKYQDVMGSEDEFELGKDEVLLDENDLFNNNEDFLSATDEEVLRVDTESSDEKSGDNVSIHSHDAENTDESDINMQNWGTSKKNYYNADSFSEEEDALEEEKEALRLQKQHLSKLKESDFIDDLEEWKDQDVDEHKNLIDKSEIITETLQSNIPDNLSNEEAIDFLKKMYPEFILLSKEYQTLFPLLDPLKASYEKADSLHIKVIEQKFFSLSAYLGVLAMYFSIILDPNKDVISMKDHPIMITLVRCKELWEMVKDIDINAIETNLETQSEETSVIEDDLILNVHEEKEEKLSENIAQGIEEKSKLNYNDFNILDVEKSLLSIKNNFKEKLKDDMEQDTFEMFNSGRENTRKKSIKLYTSQINQKSKKKVRFLNTGDLDLPYPERKKERMIRSIEEAKIRMKNQNDNFSESESSSQSDDSDKNYYNMLSYSNKKRKLEKKMNYDINREREKQALIDLEDKVIDGKRKIRYDIEKNKGLIPYRPKEVRNPRVKKRKKYEAAKKKLASKVPIYKGAPKDTYKGEATGIKTHLVKSINLFMLFHGGYSAHEIVSLMKPISQEEIKIPTDIIIEVILSLIIFCIERVLYAGKLQPINYSEYVAMKHRSDDVVLTYRPNFVDIRQKRRLYQQSKTKEQ
ncbi:hypothetical protein PMAC_001449 [Pneumocystis sp. 'macacae']|nr:hypothetical protein PMAC_001449 [Pneumocystis sp. 'macacae']